MLRDDIRQRACDAGRYDIKEDNGCPPEPILIHWSYSISTSTQSGLSLAHAVVVDCGSDNETTPPPLVAVRAAPGNVFSAPRWDPNRRELWLDGLLVKRFRQPSPNQEKILSVFQEEGWPSSIDDPLPQDFGQNPKRRLNQTISNLNRCHQTSLIRFEGDGTGESVMWNRILRIDRSQRQLLQRLR